MSKFNERAYKLFEEWSIKTHGKMSQPKVVDFTGIPQATISKIKTGYRKASSVAEEIFALVWDAFVTTYDDGEFAERLDEIEKKCAKTEGGE